MIVTLVDIEEMYKQFANEPTTLLDWFAPDGQYVQKTSYTNAKGCDAIREMLAVWKESFRGLHFSDFTVRDANQRAGEIPGATQCFYVEYIGSGRYVKDFPGLDLAPATDGQVHFPVRDVIWLEEGKILVLSNDITDLGALW